MVERQGLEMSDLTETGVVALGAIPWGTRVCNLSPGAVRELIAPFLRAGLDRGERCLWVVGDELPIAQARAALAADLDRGDLTIVSRGDAAADAWLAGAGQRGGRVVGPCLHPPGDRTLALCNVDPDACTGRELVAVLARHDRAVVVGDGGVAAVAVPVGTGGDAVGETFASLIGHDLRNPINVVSLAADLLMARFERDETVRGAAQRILRNTRRMEVMLGDVLDFVRARWGGGLPLSRQSMKIGGALRLVVERLGDAHPERVIRLDVAGEVRGQWDAARVEQALAIAVGHAAERGDVEIVCRVEGGDQLVDIRDDGPPRSDDERATVFEPFGGRGREGKSGADLGLGLYLAHAIARGHGGDLTAPPEPRGGALVLRLPGA